VSWTVRTYRLAVGLPQACRNALHEAILALRRAKQALVAVVYRA